MKKNKIIYYVCILIFLISIAEAHNFHGAAMAPNTLSGWVVTIDTPLVFHTSDGGHIWNNQSFLDALSYFDVFSLNAQKAWIGGNSGFIHYTPNGGQNWYLQAQGLSKWAARIFFINDTCGWAACGGAFIGKTTRGNDTIYHMDLWEQINLTNPPYSADSCDIYGIHFIDENRGWFCAGRYPEYDSIASETLYTRGQGYIAKTADGGGNALTWQLLRRDTIYDFFDIKFIDSLTGFVVGGNDQTNAGVVMKTLTGGQNWQTVIIPTQTKILRAIEIVGNRHLWAVGRNGTIIRSVDGGNTWSWQISGVDTTLFDVDFADTLNGLIAGNGYVLYTHDGGTNWSIADVYGIEEQTTKFPSPKSQIPIKVIPNPFYTQTIINIPNLNSQEHILQIFSVTGNLIKSFKTNQTSVIWNGKDMNERYVPSGVYFVRVKSDKNSSIVPIIFIK
jgi:photosystem II stability/assembly factor-like uncharacterized protein